MDPLLLMKSLWPALPSRLSMLEPSPRYSPTVGGGSLVDTRNLDTAVDLSRKASEAEPEDSEDEAPLDLKVRSGVKGSKEAGSPLQRAEILRIAEIYNGPPPNSFPRSSRDSSQERENEVPRCNFCGEESEAPEFVPSDHGEGVCQKGSLACSLCAKTFTQWSHFDAHKKCHAKLKQRQYPCQSCGKVFTSASNRNMHQRIHKGVRPFQCTPCGVYFRQKAHLQKHQKTQGHIQASELREKRGLKYNQSSNNNNGGTEEEEEDTGSGGEESSSLSSSHYYSLDESVNPDSSTSDFPNHNKSRSSPKRKQLKPRRNDLLLENKIRSFVHYNESSHGYECYECAFGSHELSTLKSHVRSVHLRFDEESEDIVFKCAECVLTFIREFNLKIHNKKHEGGGNLQCDICEEDFKVPHTLLKHMERAHTACPYCGRIQDDKESLDRHAKEFHKGEEEPEEVEEEMMEEDTSVVAPDDEESVTRENNDSLLAPPPMTSTPNISLENRVAKMRKLDSLAESIRLKQELQKGSSSTSSSGSLNNNNNNNNKPLLSPGRRKNDMTAVRALLSKTPEPPTGLNALVSQLTSKIHNPDLIKRENNNGPSKIPHSPPVSPVPGRISGEVSVTLVKGGASESDEDNVGLDLTVGRRNRDDSEDRRRPSAFPPHLTPFPFFGLHPPGADPAFTEHLLKLAGIPSEPSKVPSSSSPSSLSTNPYTMLSAMLGSTSFQPVFPGLPPTLMPPSLGGDKDVTGSLGLNPPEYLNKPSSSAGSSRLLSDNRSSSSATSPSSSSGKPFRCTFCRKEFGHLSSLDSHMEHMHSGEAKHACETCGKSFSSKSNLTAHKKIHSGERPFECVICHKRFRQKAHLQKHETTHSSATPYKCTVCDKAFGHPSNLNTHMATHSNIRPYHCTDCGKSYKDSASFKRHRAGHTGERPHSCSSCSEAFVDSKSLRRHREISHPGEALDSVGEDDDEEEDSSKFDGSSGYSSFETSKSLLEESK